MTRAGEVAARGDVDAPTEPVPTQTTGLSEALTRWHDAAREHVVGEAADPTSQGVQWIAAQLSAVNHCAVLLSEAVNQLDPAGADERTHESLVRSRDAWLEASAAWPPYLQAGRGDARELRGACDALREQIGRTFHESDRWLAPSELAERYDAPEQMAADLRLIAAMSQRASNLYAYAAESMTESERLTVPARVLARTVEEAPAENLKAVRDGQWAPLPQQAPQAAGLLQTCARADAASQLAALAVAPSMGVLSQDTSPTATVGLPTPPPPCLATSPASSAVITV